jgi:energy-converting hydrogenase Eha subunit E
MFPWLEIAGWVGSILVVLSLTQARVLRFRWLNLIGSLVATTYNALLGIWPFAAMNAAISLINIYWLLRLNRERHDAAVYEVVEVAPDDAYLLHVLRTHAADIASVAPEFVAVPEPGEERSAFLVQRGDETVGVVEVRDAGDGVGVVELDWVTKRFRDFTPGEFVYRRSGIFASKGFDRVVVPQAGPGEVAYLRSVGFRPEGSAWVRDVVVGSGS